MIQFFGRLDISIPANGDGLLFIFLIVKRITFPFFCFSFSLS